MTHFPIRVVKMEKTVTAFYREKAETLEKTVNSNLNVVACISLTENPISSLRLCQQTFVYSHRGCPWWPLFQRFIRSFIALPLLLSTPPTFLPQVISFLPSSLPCFHSSLDPEQLFFDYFLASEYCLWIGFNEIQDMYLSWWLFISKGSWYFDVYRLGLVKIFEDIVIWLCCLLVFFGWRVRRRWQGHWFRQPDMSAWSSFPFLLLFCAWRAYRFSHERLFFWTSGTKQ